MKRYVASILMGSAMLCTPARAETIFEALGEAYNSNPDLQAQRAQLRSIDENIAIAKSGYRPTVELVGGYKDVRNNSELRNEDDGSRSSKVGARITQQLFSGLSTYNSVLSADSNIRAAQHNLSAYEQNIFLSASEAFLNVGRDEAIVDLQKSNEKLLQKQLEETQERFKVGELTRTDVAQAKSSLSQATASRISAEGNLQVSRAIYNQVIGKKPLNLKEPSDIKKFLPENFETALNYTIENNYNVLAAKKRLSASEYEVKAQYGALMPQIVATGEVAQAKNDPNHRGLGDDTVDSVEFGVSLNIPLYDSGESRAKIRQSKYAKWQAHEQVLSAERAAVARVTGYWESMVANDAMIKALLDRVNANKIALDGVKKEETLGNRTILDVLNAYQSLLDSQVEVVKARREYYLSAMQVIQAMGKLTAEDLKLDVTLYQPKKYYKETRGKWLSVSADKE